MALRRRAQRGDCARRKPCHKRVWGASSYDRYARAQHDSGCICTGQEGYALGKLVAGLSVGRNKNVGAMRDLSPLSHLDRFHRAKNGDAILIVSRWLGADATQSRKSPVLRAKARNIQHVISTQQAFFLRRCAGFWVMTIPRLQQEQARRSKIARAKAASCGAGLRPDDKARSARPRRLDLGQNQYAA
jgi:hypothetical protein